MQLIYLYIPYRLHKIAFLEYTEFIYSEIHLIRWLSDTKKDRSLSIFLENERSFTLRILLNNFKILIVLLCVSTPHIQYDWDIHTVWNCFFVGFSITLWEHHMSLKVPEVEKFYKLPDSRAVVEFRINTGFTASYFFGTLLVAFAQIKDSYISTRCSATTHSTWQVYQHKSINGIS